MSFLAEVLSSANKIEVSTIVEKTPNLTLLIDDTKKELLNYLDNVFIKYSQPVRKGTNSSEKVNAAIIMLTELEQCVKEVTKKDIGNIQTEITSYEKKLTVAKEEVRILQLFISIHDNLIEAKRLLRAEKYIETVNLIQDIKINMDLLQQDESLVILEDIQIQIAMLESQFQQQIHNKLFQYIEHGSNGKICYFEIKSNIILQKLFSAYAQWTDYICELNEITKFLWDHVFIPIANYTVIVKVTFLNDVHRLEIEMLDKTAKGSYKDVFENITVVLDFFEQHFKFSLQNYTTLEYIGNDLQDNLSELLIKNCLNETIPNSTEELRKYDDVIKDVEVVQSKLVNSGFFSADMNSLLDYVNKAEEHYIKKKCQIYLTTATDLMKKDLHNMIEVGEPVDLDNTFTLDQDIFYQRSISKSCLELLEFTEKVLEQILKPSEHSGIIYHTIKTIFTQYGVTVQEHHQKLLQTIPQQVALFMNNCTYLSYKLTLWDETYGKKIKQVLGIEDLFSYEIHRLKFIGNKAFEEFIAQQIKQMEQIIKESGLINICTLEELEPITEKCIRQCLRQQELLKTVWHKVLSYSDYNKHLGMTLNFLCQCIIEAALKFKDISSKAGDQLVDVLKVIFTRGPKLFTDPKDVFLYVELWHKLNELSFVLSSNLLEIADRWADGKGPLALQFKPDELKQLIKALFQNTARRTAVLSRITNTQ